MERSPANWIADHICFSELPGSPPKMILVFITAERGWTVFNLPLARLHAAIQWIAGSNADGSSRSMSVDRAACGCYQRTNTRRTGDVSQLPPFLACAAPIRPSGPGRFFVPLHNYPT